MEAVQTPVIVLLLALAAWSVWRNGRASRLRGNVRRTLLLIFFRDHANASFDDFLSAIGAAGCAECRRHLIRHCQTLIQQEFLNRQLGGGFNVTLKGNRQLTEFVDQKAFVRPEHVSLTHDPIHDPGRSTPRSPSNTPRPSS